MSKKLAENLTLCGFDTVQLKGNLPDTAVSVIIHYYAYEAQKKSGMAKKLALSFAAIGIRKFFQDAKGFSQDKPPMSREEAMRQLIGVAEKYANIQGYASNKKGLRSILDAAEEVGSKSLPGIMTLSECVPGWDGMKPGLKSWIGRTVSDTYRAMYGEPPVTIWRSCCRPDGSPIKRPFKVYPVEFNAEIMAVLAAIPASLKW